MTEQTKAAVEAAIDLFKGWVRPIVTLVGFGVICAMAYQGTLDTVTWQFWAVYSGFAGSWLGEGTVNLISKVKK